VILNDSKLSNHKAKVLFIKHKFRFFKFVVFVTSTIGVLFLMGAIFVANNDSRGLDILKQKITRMYGVENIRHLSEIAGYKLRSLLYPPSVNRIDINMKHIDVQKIEFMRQQALNGNKKFDYVPIKISYDNNIEVKAKLRLKGDRKVHYQSFEDASFRIKIKKNNTLLGMKTFSIQRPRVRNYAEEWIFLQMMREEGIVTPRYEFADIVFNGKNRGLFNIEEHYTKYLIENNQNREGPIIRFKEGAGSSENFRLAAIEPFESKKWSTGKRLLILEKAVNLLKGFQKDELSVGQVFDLKKMATFFAINDLNATKHGMVTKSMRFYYNPITSKLEPVPFDGHRGTENKMPLFSIAAGIGLNQDDWIYKPFGSWFRVFFNDEKTYNEIFYSHYVSELKRVSDVNYLDNFFENNHEFIDNILLKIYSSIPFNDNVFSFGPFPYYFDKSSYYKTQEEIRSILKGSYLEAYLAGESKDQIFIDIRNKNVALPYQIVGLKIGDKILNLTSSDSMILVHESNESRRRLKRFYFDKKGSISKIKSSVMKVLYKYPGQDQIFSYKVYPFKEKTDNLALDQMRIINNINEFSFIDVDDIKGIVSIKTGKYSISKSLIVPDGYVFKMQKGTEVILKDGASIISYSPLEWSGTDDDPIKIIGSLNNNSSDHKSGGGVLVLNTSQLSKLSNVKLIGLSSPQSHAWSISGAITFYKSDAYIDHMLITLNNSEDGLNMVNSKLKIIDSEFIDIKSDAIDVDYGSAEILKTTFRNIGNDAIDISGAQIFVNDVNLYKVGDKGISAGENGNVTGNNLSINESEIGITSKDSSVVDLTNVNLTNVKLAYTAFQKKSEYGPAAIKITRGFSSNHKLLHLIEINSVLQLNERIIVGSRDDVKKTLYGVEYGKETVK
jgi:hypothetical protein